MDEHLKNAHKLERKMENGKKGALSKHQAQLQKQEAQASKNGMAPNRFHQVQAALLSFQPVRPLPLCKNKHSGTSCTKIGFLAQLKVSAAPSGNFFWWQPPT
jgi:hypothetical protein